MMKKGILFLCLAMFAIFLSACGKGEPLQENSYKDFRDEINNEDFTGFAYMLADEQAMDDNYTDILKEIFKNEDVQLVYYNDMTASKKEQKESSDDSTKVDMIFPMDEVCFIKNGKPISKIDVTSSILTSEGNNSITKFVQKHKNQE